jgi:hypothetical protein
MPIKHGQAVLSCVIREQRIRSPYRQGRQLTKLAWPSTFSTDAGEQLPCAVEE